MQAIAITRMTVRSSLRTRRLLLLGALEIIPALVYLLVAIRLTADRALDAAVGTSLFFYIPLLFPFVAMLIASGALGGERRDGTLSFLVLRPIPRSLISASKLVAAGLVATLLNTIGATALAGAYLLASGSAALLLPLLLGAAIVSFAYTTIFLPLGYLTQWAVIIGLAFLFVFENGIASALSGLATLSPWRIGYSAAAALLPPEATFDAADLGNVAPGVWGALAKTAVLIVLSIAFVTALLRTRDIT